jgi:hypothetical protein
MYFCPILILCMRKKKKMSVNLSVFNLLTLGAHLFQIVFCLEQLVFILLLFFYRECHPWTTQVSARREFSEHFALVCGTLFQATDLSYKFGRSSLLISEGVHGSSDWPIQTHLSLFYDLKMTIACLTGDCCPVRTAWIMAQATASGPKSCQ